MSADSLNVLKYLENWRSDNYRSRSGYAITAAARILWALQPDSSSPGADSNV